MTNFLVSTPSKWESLTKYSAPAYCFNRWSRDIFRMFKPIILIWRWVSCTAYFRHKQCAPILPNAIHAGRICHLFTKYRRISTHTFIQSTIVVVFRNIPLTGWPFLSLGRPLLLCHFIIIESQWCWLLIETGTSTLHPNVFRQCTPLSFALSCVWRTEAAQPIASGKGWFLMPPK